MKPLYEHDCSACEFIRTHSEFGDIYVCPSKLLGKTVVIRYSNEPSNNSSYSEDLLLSHDGRFWDSKNNKYVRSPKWDLATEIIKEYNNR
jgi:hypothetical protein